MARRGRRCARLSPRQANQSSEDGAVAEPADGRVEAETGTQGETVGLQREPSGQQREQADHRPNEGDPVDPD